MDLDPLGLDEEQEYHEDVLEWLTEHNATPELEQNQEDVKLLTPDGKDITDDFLGYFSSEFDGFQVEKQDKPIEVSIYTTDYNHYQGGTVVYWTGTKWELRNGN
jgi:hypothetical protein